jgi:phosphohistidine swiveling domain-containing protein
VLAGPEDLDRLEDGVIAVCETLFYDLIPFIPRLGGLVTELGGALATVLDYARQFGVPAVVGVKGLMETVRDGETLWVDADFGVIAVI